MNILYGISPQSIYKVYFGKKSMPPYGFKYYLNWLRAKLNLQALILVAGFYAFLWL
jgi:hypothetical protein